MGEVFGMTFTPDEELYEECLDCGGSGEDEDGYPCDYCDGTGMVEHDCW